MIWLCGDTHGQLDIEKAEDYIEEVAYYSDVTKDDYLIILGDVGVCWDNDVQDAMVKYRLQNLPCTVLFLDGNHENFNLLDDYPVEDWHGGKVHFIAEDIIHLMRGQVYELEGKKLFVFGGGCSIDRGYRTRGYDWWPEEMPAEDEKEEGLINLRKNNFEVDYILTHTCPEYVAKRLVPILYPGEEDLQQYFNHVAKSTDFIRWYFGHWHMDQSEDRFQCLWNDIVELD